jgi:hypothetical protein
MRTGSGVTLSSAIPHPGGRVVEALRGMLGQAGDHRAGQTALAHVGQGLGIDHVIAVASPQHLQEVQPAPRGGGRECGEVVVAELGANTVLLPVAGTGVVDADPARGRQARPQHIARLFENDILASGQQLHDLPLGNRDADRPKLCHQAGHRDLTLVVLEQHEAAQLRPEVTADLGRHRRDHRSAVRGQPAFTADADNMRPQHEILDEEVLVALEAGARRNLRLDDALLAGGAPLALAALGAAFPALAGRLGLGALVHAARLHRRSALQALEGRNLRPQLGDRLLQRGILR